MPPPGATHAQFVRCRRPAMASLFEIWLAGDDAEHLTAVGEAALDEVVRIEQLLSYFDSASEIARINREAAARPARVDREVFAILRDCETWRRKTDGFFEVCFGHATGEGSFHLDAAARTVRFASDALRINLGGYGKGYALDAAGEIIRRHGVAMALLHGGTSSILAIGSQPDAAPWKIGLRDPFAETKVDHDEAPSAEIGRVELADAGFSTSAVFHADEAASDIMNPIGRQPLAEQAACAVIAPTALAAEVWSTALLAMGRANAGAIVRDRKHDDAFPTRAAWLSQVEGETNIEWFHEVKSP